MDLALHLRVLWRFKGVLVAGVLLGIAGAVLASYRVSIDGAPKLTPRGTEEWTSRSELLVTQPGFPWGRVTLPGTGEPGALVPPLPTTGKNNDKRGLQFADPGRFATLASLYSVISFSDQARERLPRRVEPSQIQALPRTLDASNTILPIVVIVTRDGTKAQARELNVDAVAALRDLLREHQAAAKIGSAQRVSLQTLNYPSAGELAVGRSYTNSIIAFVLCLVCAIAWTHILHNLGGLSNPLARSPRPVPATPPADWDAVAEPERPGPVAPPSVGSRSDHEPVVPRWVPPPSTRR